MKALFDTNILIDYLNGISAARDEIARYEHKLISPITWMEVMVGTNSGNEVATQYFLSLFLQIPITSTVAERAVLIRKQQKIRLPDAIIWATAQTENALLISRNIKDFPESAADVRVPYQL